MNLHSSEVLSSVIALLGEGLLFFVVRYIKERDSKESSLEQKMTSCFKELSKSLLDFKSEISKDAHSLRSSVEIIESQIATLQSEISSIKDLARYSREAVKDVKRDVEKSRASVLQAKLLTESKHYEIHQIRNQLEERLDEVKLIAIAAKETKNPDHEKMFATIKKILQRLHDDVEKLKQRDGGEIRYITPGKQLWKNKK